MKIGGGESNFTASFRTRPVACLWSCMRFMCCSSLAYNATLLITQEVLLPLFHPKQIRLRVVMRGRNHAEEDLKFLVSAKVRGQHVLQFILVAVGHHNLENFVPYRTLSSIYWTVYHCDLVVLVV